MQQLSRNNPQKLIDVLNERLTFERAGVKLYDAVLARVRGSGDPQIARMAPSLNDARNQEKDHEEWLEEQIRALGGDAHGRTDLSNLVQTESMGIEEVVLGGDQDIGHLFHALLTAELVDNNGWQLLLQLADEADDDDARQVFKRFLHEEDQHLLFIRRAVATNMSRQVLGGQAQMPSSPMG